MKRFLLFAGAAYYPEGGWREFKRSFDTREKAVAAGNQAITKEHGDDWFHVVDFKDGSITDFGRRAYRKSETK